MRESTPIYRSVVLLVNDIRKSKNFYRDILGQKVMMDFGKNVGFEGGLAIWEKDYALNLIFQEKTQNIQVGTNNAEIYFEFDDLKSLFIRLNSSTPSLMEFKYFSAVDITLFWAFEWLSEAV